MKRIPLFAGLVLAAVLMFKVYHGEISAVDVLIMQNGHQSEANITQVNAKNAEAEKAKEQTKIETADNPEKLTIMAFGDMMMGRYVRTLMDRKGMDYPFLRLDFDTPFFGKADVRFANLEGPIKGKGFESGTSTTFGFNEDVAPFLKNYGFNVLSIANNHALDQHNDGRDSTVKAVEKEQIGWCGKIADTDEKNVYYSKIDNASYAFVCLNDVIYPLDRTKALELVKNVREKVDYLVISIHWGIEYSHRPNKNAQVDFGHALIENGADIIIGHHPHVVQSFENYKGKFIFYSLGNFIFDQYWSKDTQEELAIKIELDKDSDGKLATKVNLFPLKSERSQPRLLNTEENKNWLEKFITYGSYDDAMKEKIRSGVVTASEE